MADRIESFTGRYDFLSNFYMRPFKWDGCTWKSGEHAFNASKTLVSGERRWVQEADTALEAKRRGRAVRLRDDWDHHWRYVLMHDILRAKFAESPMSDRLIDTHDSILVEGNTWHDNIWGVCRCKACPKGRNCLGIFLMQIRYDLIKEKR